MGLRMAQAYFAALANDGRAAVPRMRPTPLFRLRDARPRDLGQLAIESPLTGTVTVPTPTIAHVTSGTPETGDFGTDGIPRSAGIGFLADGIAIDQLTMEPRGWSYGGWFNPAALTRDMPLLAPKTVSVSDSDPGHLLALQCVDQVTVAGEG
jgi:hypothetical protein